MSGHNWLKLVLKSLKSLPSMGGYLSDWTHNIQLATNISKILHVRYNVYTIKPNSPRH